MALSWAERRQPGAPAPRRGGGSWRGPWRCPSRMTASATTTTGTATAVTRPTVPQPHAHPASADTGRTCPGARAELRTPACPRYRGPQLGLELVEVAAHGQRLPALRTDPAARGAGEPAADPLAHDRLRAAQLGGELAVPALVDDRGPGSRLVRRAEEGVDGSGDPSVPERGELIDPQQVLVVQRERVDLQATANGILNPASPAALAQLVVGDPDRPRDRGRVARRDSARIKVQRGREHLAGGDRPPARGCRWPACRTRSPDRGGAGRSVANASASPRTVAASSCSSSIVGICGQPPGCDERGAGRIVAQQCLPTPKWTSPGQRRSCSTSTGR